VHHLWRRLSDGGKFLLGLGDLRLRARRRAMAFGIASPCQRPLRTVRRARAIAAGVAVTRTAGPLGSAVLLCRWCGVGCAFAGPCLAGALPFVLSVIAVDQPYIPQDNGSYALVGPYPAILLQ
jgi:hypothetical protein